MKLSLFAVSLALLCGCAVTSHSVKRGDLGTPKSSTDMLAVVDEPGPIVVESVNSADWSVPLEGLVNLDAPAAKEAKLEDREEPIQVYFHVLRHPTRGIFFIDTGVEKALRDDPDKSAAAGPVASFMHLERMKVHMPPGEWLVKEKAQLAGVFFTHMHFDHITGMPDIPKGTPLYSGPTELTWKRLSNIAVRGVTNRALDGHVDVSELPFEKDAGGRFDGVLDVFGDGSLWAIWVPGHTPGSVAYIARTADGPILFTGDTSHTAWGWEHSVEPGDFTDDQELNRKALIALKALAAEHPKMQVRLGHQSLSAKTTER